MIDLPRYRRPLAILGGLVMAAILFRSATYLPGHEVDWLGDASADRAYWSLVVYWLGLATAFGLGLAFHTRVRSRPPRFAAGDTARVLLLWQGLTTLITATGAAVGSLLFLSLGRFFTPATPWGELAWSGARQIGFLTFVWAPGLAIVLCVMAHHRPRPAPGG